MNDSTSGSAESPHGVQPADTAPLPSPVRGRDTVQRAARAVRRLDMPRRRDGAPLRYDPFDRGPDVGAEPLPSSSVVPLLATLRASVTVYVCARRRENVPIWRVVTEVKGLVREADPDPLSFEGQALLVAQVVRWTIEAYYDAPAGPLPRLAG